MHVLCMIYLYKFKSDLSKFGIKAETACWIPGDIGYTFGLYNSKKFAKVIIIKITCTNRQTVSYRNEGCHL